MATYEDLLKAVQELKDKANEYAPDSLERTMLLDPNIQRLEEFIEQADKTDESERSDPHMRGLYATSVSAAKTGSWNVVKKESKRKDIDYVKRFL